MDIGSGIAAGVGAISITAVIIKWMSQRVVDKAPVVNAPGLCLAHVDLTNGLTAFRSEVRLQFEALTSEIMELCKQVKR
jgi:hypothetical protein